MNNKILIIIIVLLIGFLAYDKIVSKTPNDVMVVDNSEISEPIIEENNFDNEIIDVCLNIEGVQSVLPEGMTINGDLCEIEPVIVTETKIVREVVNKQPPQPVNQPISPEPEEVSTSSTPSEPARSFKEDGTLDLSVYQEITVSDYVNNSNKYLNKPIKIKNATIASYNSYSNDSNYIKIIDKSDYSDDPKTITIEIKDNNFYSELVDNTEEFTNVIVFGFGTEDREFNIINSTTGSTYKDFVNTIVSDSIYKCNDSCIYTYSNGVKLIFKKKK